MKKKNSASDKKRVLAACLAAALLLLPVLPVSGQAVVAYLSCDVSMNGKIGSEDARLVLRMAVGLESYTAAQKKIADTDDSGDVTPADARLILRMSVGLEKMDIRLYSFTNEELNTYVFTAAGDKAAADPQKEDPQKEKSQTDPENVPTDKDFPLPQMPVIWSVQSSTSQSIR